jgi:hypothetical protein
MTTINPHFLETGDSKPAEERKKSSNTERPTRSLLLVDTLCKFNW